MGAQNMYDATFEVAAGDTVSDRQPFRFAVREVTSELTPEGHRLFKINGKPILIRGGGWSQDMFERPMTDALLHAHLRYVKEMGLNTIRQEGKIDTDEFYDLADEEGILVMPGWCCCDQWELWNQWTLENYTVGRRSRSAIRLLRLRNHPSIFVWLNGSDEPPIAAVESRVPRRSSGISTGTGRRSRAPRKRTGRSAGRAASRCADRTSTCRRGTG